jgi:hypothetical protein
MSENAKIATLLSEIEKSRGVLVRIGGFYDDYLTRSWPLESRSTEQAIVVADVLVSYYTALETLFLRISQFFENELAPEKWHRDLLRRMTLRIEGVREPVIADATGEALGELLKFRHFKRYYFQFTYDWDRLDFLRKKLDVLRPLVESDLDRFCAFLRQLMSP